MIDLLSFLAIFIFVFNSSLRFSADSLSVSIPTTRFLNITDFLRLKFCGIPDTGLPI